MRIALGDVVRIKSDKVLGTVVSITSTGRGSVVHLHTDGLGSRAVSPDVLEPIARAYKPMTTRRAIATLVFLAIGIAVAVTNAATLSNLGAALPLTAFVAVSSLGTVTGFLIRLFHRPRATRV